MLIYFVFAPILLAIFLYLFPFPKIGRMIAIFAQALLVAATFYLFSLSRQAPIIENIGNYESVLGITLRVDPLASVFILLTVCVFLVAAIYSYHEPDGRMFWSFLFIWESGLIGLFLVQDFFNIFVLLEVITVIIAVLIMFRRHKRSMYDGMVYLMINTVATQFYLFGVGYIYLLTGVLDMEVAAETLRGLDSASLFLPYALFMTAIAFKCAVVPLFSWLPMTHGTPGAPSSVSAILSGVQIKAGLYMFLRFQYVFYDVALREFFLVIGILTGFVGIILALGQSDIKRILACSTVAQVGLILVGLNLNDEYAYLGSLYHIINHALFKAALFLSAGMIRQAYKTRDINEIRGVLRHYPLVGVATILAVLGITGTPLFNGSISKYFIMSGLDWFLTGVIILINLGTILIFIKYSVILFGTPKTTAKPFHFAKSRQVAILIFGISCFIGGIFGEQLIYFLFNVPVNTDAAGSLEKIVTYLLSWAVGFLLFKYYVRESRLLQRLSGADLGFRGICASMGVFFAVVLLVVNFSF